MKAGEKVTQWSTNAEEALKAVQEIAEDMAQAIVHQGQDIIDRWDKVRVIVNNAIEEN